MKITNEAKEAILALLKENEVDTLNVSVTHDGHHHSINLEIGNKDEFDRVISINDMNVAISEEDENALEHIVLDLRDGELFLFDEGHHCCHGHGHHDGEGCCHDHEHNHEEGCCHNHEHHEGECCCGDDCECEEEHSDCCCSEDK